MNVYKSVKMATLAVLVMLTACVTINVYFPAAEAESAAREFVNQVLGEEEASAQPKPNNPSAFVPTTNKPVSTRSFVVFDPVGFFIGTAHAQEKANISLRTPAIQQIQSRMTARMSSQLSQHFDSGALGFTRDGMIELRDPSAVPLKDRVGLNGHVADDNRDRNALYREVAVANGHPEWEPQIREVFAEQWREAARSGWWYQDRSGSWKQK